VYVDILKDIDANTSMTIHLHKENIKCGVRQAATISLQMYTAKSIFRLLTWKIRGVRTDGE